MLKKLKIFAFTVSAILLALSRAEAATQFETAAQLLSAARAGDVQYVERLVNAGANVNFVDNTGLSIVCTALMNNDVRAAQILQVYGADASNCDQQIKKYNKKLPKEESGGLFSGLSTAQSMLLAAAGAAVVVGGLVWLADSISGGNSNTGSNSTDRPNSGGGSSGTTSTLWGTLPEGPISFANYDPNFYSDTAILEDDFTLMTTSYKENYLLIMHGYAPLARGYMGMRTLRNLTTHAPLSLSSFNLGSNPVLGGRPVNVALITKNGINESPDNSLQDTFLVWTTCNGTNCSNASAASNDMVSSKYYNNKITKGADNGSITDDVASENSDTLSIFDLAGGGSAIHSATANELDNLLAKVIIGNTGGDRSVADFMGFMPNGQLSVFKTGGGTGFVALTTPTAAGTLNDSVTVNNAWDAGETVTIGSITDIRLNANGTITSVSTPALSGYKGVDGVFYIDVDGDGVIDKAFSMATGSTTVNLVKQLGDIDYMNYKAMRSAVGFDSGSVTKVIANAAANSALYDPNSQTISDILSYSSSSRKAAFAGLVNQYYDQVSDSYSVGTDATAFFNGLGSTYSPITIFSTGASETDSSFSGAPKEASFENSAPLVFDNLEHLFMSVVAVSVSGTGTSGATSVTGYAPTGKIVLSQWGVDTNGDSTVDTYYKSRICGIGGTGTSTIDPWCFSAAGVTDELAVASMAGAVGSVQSAFDYMDNKEIFLLLALTSDGQTLTDAELQNLYTLPAYYQSLVDNGVSTYANAFMQVFGYGLPNLERATLPGSKLYYYSTDKVNPSDGKGGYWVTRAASVSQLSVTKFATSSAFGSRSATISAPVFDTVESSDGSVSIPRVWDNTFTLGTDSARGLYMGDLLGEFKTGNSDDVPEQRMGNMFSKISFSESVKDGDNLSGLDTMKLGYNSGDITLTGEFSRHFHDSENVVARGDTSNPILSLASNATKTSFAWKSGNWTFGALALSGEITDDGLMENDPAISGQYIAASIGKVNAAESSIAYNAGVFKLASSVGTMNESDTVLGAYTDGLLGLGGGTTTYVDAKVETNIKDYGLHFWGRATFAQTASHPTGDLIIGVSNIESNAFSAGVDWHGFSFAVSQPLAVVNGNMEYATMNYDVIANSNGGYDLDAAPYVGDLNLAPNTRETRLSGAYRTKLGAFTDGAIGFIYRINPNHTNEFGNESIMMFKVTHRLGI